MGFNKPAKRLSKNPFEYNGYYLCKFDGLKDFTSTKGNFTCAEFTVEIKPGFPESIYLSDGESTPDLYNINMVLKSFGATQISEGATPDVIMAALSPCFGKPCAILMVPVPSKKNPTKSYHRVLSTSESAIAPVANVGTLYDGELPVVKSTETTPPANTNANKTPF